MKYKPRTCAISACGKTFTPKKSWQKYHDNECRQLGFWMAKIARMEAKRKKRAEPRSKNRTARA